MYRTEADSREWIWRVSIYTLSYLRIDLARWKNKTIDAGIFSSWVAEYIFCPSRIFTIDVSKYIEMVYSLVEEL